MVGRKTFTKDAKVLAKKKCQAAVDILDKFLAGQKITDEQLRFADRVGAEAAAYAFGKPVQTQVVGGDGGEPIRTEASGDGLVDLKETMRRAALGLYMADRQNASAGPASSPGVAAAGAGAPSAPKAGADPSPESVPAPTFNGHDPKPEKPPAVEPGTEIDCEDGHLIKLVMRHDNGREDWAVLQRGDPRDIQVRRLPDSSQDRARQWLRLFLAEQRGEL